MRASRWILVVVTFAVLAGLNSSCYKWQGKKDHTPLVLCIVGDCDLKVLPPIGVDQKRYEKIYQGQPLIFCNKSNLPVWIAVDDGRLMTRGSAIYLLPGERFNTRARGNLTKRDVKFVFTCKDKEAEEEETTVEWDTDEEPEEPPGGTKNPPVEEDGEG